MGVLIYIIIGVFEFAQEIDERYLQQVYR